MKLYSAIFETVCCVILFTALAACNHKPVKAVTPKYETVIKAVFKHDYTEQQKSDALAVLNKRFAHAADTAVDVRMQGDTIEIRVPGDIEGSHCIELVSTRGELQLMKTYAAEDIYAKLLAKSGKYHAEYASLKVEGYRVPGPEMCFVELSDTAHVSELFAKPETRRLLPADCRFLWSTMRNGTHELLVAVEYRPYFDNSMIKTARTEIDQMTGIFQIYFEFKDEYHKQWEQFTSDNIGKPVAIVIDNKVYSYPIVYMPIEGGQCSVTGNFSASEAKTLAAAFAGGVLNTVVEITQVNRPGIKIASKADL